MVPRQHPPLAGRRRRAPAPVSPPARPDAESPALGVQRRPAATPEPEVEGPPRRARVGRERGSTPGRPQRPAAALREAPVTRVLWSSAARRAEGASRPRRAESRPPATSRGPRPTRARSALDPALPVLHPPYAAAVPPPPRPVPVGLRRPRCLAPRAGGSPRARRRAAGTAGAGKPEPRVARGSTAAVRRRAGQGARRRLTRGRRHDERPPWVPAH